MYLFQANLRPIFNSCINSKTSRMITSRKNHSSLDQIENFKKMNSSSIVISLSRDVYRNLAFEDWLYKNYDFSTHQIYLLLMWSNGSSVVIGRHQNPWLECSMDFSQASGISVVRRNSGGGTVYHDLGNLNCSFMSPRSKYDRKSNLNMICEALQKKWPLNLSVSQREDLLLDEKYKVSGTASKLGRSNAYHHCTILIDVELMYLHQVLHREMTGVESKATTSIKSEVKNLKTACADVSLPQVMGAVAKEYQSIYKVSRDSFYRIEPSEEIFPGIKSIEDHLRSWEWCFGKTPPFHITRSFPLCPSFSKWECKQMPSDFNLEVSVVKGCISDVLVKPDIMDHNSLESFTHSVVGTQFSGENAKTALENWASVSKDTILNRYIRTCTLQSVLDVHR